MLPKALFVAAVMLLIRGEPRMREPLPHPFTPCGQCACNGLAVDCSSRGLTSVPSSGLPVIATSLSLRNNSISFLGPKVFSRFTRLHWLNLSYNVIADIAVQAFSALKGLTELNLAHNHLTFTNRTECLDRRFISSESLTHLDLSFNLLHNASCSIADMFGTGLQWLALSHNGYYLNENPCLLSSLQSLLALDLSHNKLNKFSAEMFKGVAHLKSLNMSHNQILLNNDSYPVELFRLLGPSLTELRVEGNCNTTSCPEGFSYPDEVLQLLSNVQSLHIDGLPNADFGPGFQNMTSLTNLSLSGMDDSFCAINCLTNKTFLHLPHSLWSLNLSKCSISRIEIDAFRPLQHLHILDLSFNLNLGFGTLGNAFYSLQGSALKELHISSIVHPYTTGVIVTPRNTMFFKNTSLEIIHAEGNRIEEFCEGALLNMPESLMVVSVDRNELGFGNYFKDFGSLKNLKAIYIDGNRVAHEPPSAYPPQQLRQCSTGMMRDAMECPLNCHQRFQPKEIPRFGMESVHSVSTQPGTLALQSSAKLVHILPPNLHTYVSRWYALNYKILEVEFNASNSLAVLNLGHNRLKTWIGPITGLKKLATLDLGSNFADNVSTTFFSSLTSLKELNVSRNYLRIVIEHDKDGELFRPLGQLQSLYLSKNYLNAIPPHVFVGLVSLENLVLSHNEIYDFKVNISHMRNLSLLDLSYNHIRYLPKFIMDHLDSIAEYEHVSLDLTFNPIACVCERIDFLRWIVDSKVKFRSKDRLACSMSNGNVEEQVNVFDVIQSLQNSCTDKSGILVGAVSCAFCLLVAMLSALIYRYRWKLRYLYYASRLAYRRLQTCDDDDFEFDAFVSYSSEDNDFVHGELLEELETRAGLRLNVHNRDFIPGRPIPSNIVSAVQSSRRTLVVLSRELVQSEWCLYEMQMATMEAAHTGRDVLLFLLYEDVPSQQLPRDVLYNLQSSTYITFPGTRAEPSLVRDFWARLAQAIRQG
ncbi:toll-like receptor 4 [Littorina saxatilis]|uniref:TIR domain-containing protein n=1 Tax=Littorina saxatilis TaxID=31220 RepID=A0AAN9GNE2_9CAEN